MSISKSEPPLASLLSRLPAASCCCVAFSGGLDSHVLLHILASADALPGGTLAAVHVDHGIHARSGEWADHCRAVCDALGVPIDVLRVDGSGSAGESPEAAARAARYRALAEWLPRDGLLLTAQHRDDQAETVLLQLFRGAGPRGLAAMPAVTGFGAGRLARPLLGHSRAAILDYARAHDLRWIEDPSNTDTRYDRNLLRHRLMPVLRERWRGLARVLARAAALQADQARLADALAQIDVERCAVHRQPGQLNCTPLTELDSARQRNLLRYWIETNGLALPSRAVLEQIRDSVLAAQADAMPCLRWPGAELRRYGDRLYLMPPQIPPDSARRLAWNVNEALELPGGTLSAVAVAGRGLRVSADTMLEVRFRRGGERIQPAGRREHHALKKLFQDWRVPPWQRTQVPLVYRDDRLIAVAGFCVCEGFQSRPGETGYELRWDAGANPPDAAL